ncbi:MAG: hypothetical protein IH950_13745 [Bacteroidetes bacterium]|nr:hypothetical protein [Bacteroidota bacterium]
MLKNSENAEEYLKEAGYNIDELNRDGLELINVLTGKSRLELAKKKRYRLIEEIKKYLSQLNKDVKMQSRQILIDILKGEQLSFQFRDLEKLSDEDLLEMVKEEQLLKFWKELNKDK